MLLLDAPGAKLLGRDPGDRQERRPLPNASERILGKLCNLNKLSPIRKVPVAFAVVHDALGNRL